MQSKAFILFALSAAVAASPFHKRQSIGLHRHHRGTGTEGVRPTGSGFPYPRVNDTNGIFTPSESASIMPVSSALTMTVSPLPEKAASAPANFGNVATDVDASSSCVSTSLATEFSTNFITVTASGADTAETKVADVSAGAFYGGQSKSYGAGWGQSSSAAVVPVSSAPGIVPSASASSPATTFATATKSGVGASGTASASASASAAPPSSGSGGGKRGISFNDASLVSAFGNSVSWAYNWAATESGSLPVEYVPMMWGKDNVDGFADTVGSATHVLSFNEPDLGEQANIDPQTAATLHKQGMKDLVGKVQIGSPAVTNGNSDSPPMGVKWLTQFFSACGSDCPVDFVNMHWYAGADNFDYFKQCVDDVVAVAQDNGISKVWVTEFAPSGSADAQASFMKQAVEYLDGNGAVERYAAFMASDGTLLSGKTLNTIGSAYAGAS